MGERGKLAVARCAELHVMAGLGAIGRDREALVARGHQLHRPPEPFGRNGYPRRPGGDPGFQSVHRLRRLIDGQMRSVPHAGRGEELDRIVVLSRRGIARVHLDFGLGEGAGRVTDHRVGAGLAHLARFGRRAGTIERRAGRLRGIVHLHPVSRLPRRFEGLGDDDGDDLSVVPDAVAFQGRGGGALVHLRRRAGERAHVFVGQDVQNARHVPGGSQSECGDPAARDGACHQTGEGQVGDGLIGCKSRRAGDLGRAIDARGRLAEQGWAVVRHVRPPSPWPAKARAPECVGRARACRRWRRASRRSRTPRARRRRRSPR